MDLNEKKVVVYTAYSKHYFFAKEFISAFTLDLGFIPLNPFTNWGYFLSDMVDRKKIVNANNNLIMISNEVWCFGPIADGVMAEVRLAIKHNMKLRFFTVGKKISDIKEISINELVFEDELLDSENYDDLLLEIKNYIK